LLDPDAPSRLLLVAPNLALTARTLGVDRDELVLWVSIHEITHAVQFSAAPWLRDHLGGLIKELIDGMQITLAGRLPGSRGGTEALPTPAELKEPLSWLARTGAGGSETNRTHVPHVTK